MELILTRHGQTDWNKLKKVQGRADLDLNEKGIEQAKETKKILDEEEIDLILTSPLKRAVQTANVLNENRDIPIIIDERILERDFGEFEGLTRDDFDFRSYWNYQKNSKYQRAENIQDFFGRIFNFLDDIKVQYPKKRILIVAHAGISVPIKCYFEGIPQEDILLTYGLRKL